MRFSRVFFAVRAFLACTILIVAFAASASAQSKITMRLGHTLAVDSHYQLTALQFAKLLKEKTNGIIEVKVFPQSQLGGEVQMAEALRTGTQELVISAQAPIENTVKEWQVLSLPYLFDSIDDANHVLQGPVGKKFLDMLPAHNLVGLAWISVLERDVFTVKRPIKSLDDMKGLTIRVMQTPGYINGYRALGANPTPLAYNQVYLALQQGVVDGAETGPDQMVQDKFTEVAKHFYLTHVNYLPVVIAMSKITWNKLTPDLQRAVQESASESARWDLTEYKRLYNESLATLKAKGIDVAQLDIKPWMQAAQKDREEMLSKIPNGQALYKEIMAAKQASPSKVVPVEEGNQDKPKVKH